MVLAQVGKQSCPAQERTLAPMLRAALIVAFICAPHWTTVRSGEAEAGVGNETALGDALVFFQSSCPK